MKRVFSVTAPIFALIAFFMWWGALAVAQGVPLPAAPAPETPEREIVIEPSLLPDSPLYFLELLKEKVILWFTFRVEKEINRTLKFAELRMAEYRSMIEKGKTEAAQKVLSRYEDHVNAVLAKVEKLKKEQKGILKISQEMENILGRHTLILERVSGNVPAPAREAISHALEVSQQVYNRIREFQGKEAVKKELTIEEVQPAAEKAADQPQEKPAQDVRPEAPQPRNITVKNFEYAPKTMSVKVGEVVEVLNADKAPHTFTSVKGLFNSGTIQSGESWTFTVNVAKGKHAFYCAIHPSMQGTLVVE